MITVLGASGFIGTNLCRRLRELELEHYAPARDESLRGRKLGDVIYCIGLTADFRSRPFDTVDAHVCHLASIVRDCVYDSVLYLSTTRLYGCRPGLAREEDKISVRPSESDDLYNVSKAMGESLVLNCGKLGRVARISNVYGGDFASGNFLSSVIRDALAKGSVTIRTSPDSEKDYVGIDDVVDALIAITRRGQHRIYNVAFGTNVTNAALMDHLHQQTNCSIEFLAGAPQVKFPTIDIARMREEFDFCPRDLLNEFSDVVSLYKRNLTKTG